MSSEIFSIGNFSISWYSVCILIGVILAGILFITECKKYEISTDFSINMTF